MKKIVALGFFDGVHLGHQALLAACVKLAKDLEAEPCAITFDRHPRAAFGGEHPKLINRLADREQLLRQYGIREVLCCPATAEFMAKSWETFLQELEQEGAVGFVCGSDFRFGCRGEGCGEKLQTYCQARGLAWAIVEQQVLEGVRISSTYIRSLLEEGALEKANTFLGHPHVLSGLVISGRQLGRTIGIPTANIELQPEVVTPPYGVYACKAYVDGGEYLAVTNVGMRPTVGGHHVTVEPWLLDFDGDLYGKQLKLAFYEFLRPEKKFDSLEQLQAEIQENARQVRKIFEKS